MNITKKQVGYLLKIMSDDTTRPALSGLAFRDGKAWATNGYAMVGFDTKLDTEPVDEQYKVISRADIVKWYKLANTKDVLDDKALSEMATTSYRTPDYTTFLKVESVGEGSTAFDATLPYNIQMCLANKPVIEWEINPSNRTATYKTKGDGYVAMFMGCTRSSK